MLNFSGEHNINSDIQPINRQDSNTTLDRITSNEVDYRFVIDLKSLKEKFYFKKKFKTASKLNLGAVFVNVVLGCR